MHQNPRHFETPWADGPAGDTALFAAVESGHADHLYRCWRTPQPLVVAGRFRRIGDDVLEEACRVDGVPIIHRDSGGGTVVLGAGCLNYAVALSLVSRPELSDVAASFRIILDAIVEALALPGLARSETDLSLLGRKVSGNAQRRGRVALLHHGTLLFGFDVRLAERYLKEPSRQPPYRQRRRHADFLANLPIPEAELESRLEHALRRLCRPSVGAPGGHMHNGADSPAEMSCHKP